MNESTQPLSWWRSVAEPTVVRRALAYAVIVGAILIGINHGDAIWSGNVTSGRLMQMGLTVIVPYLVSTFSSVGAMRQSHGHRSMGNT